MKHTTIITAGIAATLTFSTAIAAPDKPALRKLGTYSTGRFAEAAAEIVAHDPATQRLFVVNAQNVSLDVLDISDPANPIKAGEINFRPFGGVANSVAVRDGIVAVAVESFLNTNPGAVLFLNSQLEPLASVQVGALPDMVTFSPNGRYLVVANEGEPNGYGEDNDEPSVDPEGSVSVIDLSKGVENLTQADVRTATFTAYNNATLDPSIRIYGPGATVAQDLEPEYIAVSSDSKTAWVTLQENNAMATIDLKSAKVTSLVGLGLKDHSLVRNAFDPSDRDNAAGKAGVINIQPWPTRGMYQPDSIAAMKAGNETFLIMANEGDARDWPGLEEEKRIGEADYVLDPVRFPNAASLKEPRNLGRLRATIASGDLDNDGDFDEIWTFGARSFSIRSTTGSLIWDSGDQIERITAAQYPTRFNASHDNNTLDARSPSKGQEPEGLTIGKAYGRTYAFVGLERIGGVIIYDITDPRSPVFTSYVNNRELEIAPDEGSLELTGDLGPEGLAFIADADSPNGKPLLIIGNEVSGTTTIYEFSRP